MTDINKINPGIDTSFSTKLNANLATSLRQTGLTQVQQLQDRAITLSADGGTFAEAYTDSNGRQDSVVAGFSEFDTNKFKPGFLTDEASGDTTSDPDSFTSPGNAFDSDFSTSATKTSTAATISLGKTFSAKTITKLYIKTDTDSSSGSVSLSIKLQSYDGATWSDEATLDSGPGGVAGFAAEYNGIYDLNSSVQGLRLLFTNSNPGASCTHNIQILAYTTQSDEGSVVTHTIPTGTFDTTLSSSFMTFKTQDWESGADIQYKLTNATEDTGWLASNTPVSFTALTAEPDDLIVKLIPKTTSPTAGYPSINGIALYGDRP
jgi:hypothetical protein